MRKDKGRIILERGEPCMHCIHYTDPIDMECPLVAMFKLNEYLERMLIKVEACGHYETRRKEVL